MGTLSRRDHKNIEICIKTNNTRKTTLLSIVQQQKQLY